MNSDTELPTAPGQSAPARPDPDDVGPVQALDLLIDEARSAVGEQVALAKSFASAAGLTARNVAILAVTAALLALVALMALAVGAMLSLAPVVGMPGATAIVVIGLMMMAAIVILLVRRAILRFQAAMAGSLTADE